MNQLAGLLVDEGPPACGYHCGWSIKQAGYNAAFTIAKLLLTVTLKDIHDRTSGCGLNLCICVKKRNAQLLSNPPANTAFTSSHKANKNDDLVRKLDLIGYVCIAGHVDL